VVEWACSAFRFDFVGGVQQPVHSISNVTSVNASGLCGVSSSGNAASQATQRRRRQAPGWCNAPFLDTRINQHSVFCCHYKASIRDVKRKNDAINGITVVAPCSQHALSIDGQHMVIHDDFLVMKMMCWYTVIQIFVRYVPACCPWSYTTCFRCTTTTADVSGLSTSLANTSTKMWCCREVWWGMYLRSA